MGTGTSMKILISIISLLLCFSAWSQCANPSRVGGDASGSPFKLSASRYNADLNLLYTTNKNFDGKCLSDDSIKEKSLDKTSFKTLYSSLRDGCTIRRSSAGAVAIGPCRMMINGNTVDTIVETSVVMGCADCDIDSPDSVYYVYVSKNSSGTNLAGFLSLTAPTYHDLDVSGNRCVGRVANDASSGLYYYAEQMADYGFEYADKKIISYGAGYRIAECSFTVTDTVAPAMSYTINTGECADTITTSGDGVYAVNFKANYWQTAPACFVNTQNATDANTRIVTTVAVPSVTIFSYQMFSPAAGANLDTGAKIECTGRTNL